MTNDDGERGRSGGQRRVVPGQQRRGGRAEDLSDALRRAYRSTVEENVPDELMDLIRKLK